MYQSTVYAGLYLLTGTYSNVDAALAPLVATIAASLLALESPQLNQCDTEMFEACPGHNVRGGAL